MTAIYWRNIGAPHLLQVGGFHKKIPHREGVVKRNPCFLIGTMIKLIFHLSFIYCSFINQSFLIFLEISINKSLKRNNIFMMEDTKKANMHPSKIFIIIIGNSTK